MAALIFKGNWITVGLGRRQHAILEIAAAEVRGWRAGAHRLVVAGRRRPTGWFDRAYHGFKMPNARAVSTNVIKADQTSDDFRHLCDAIILGMIICGS